MRKVGVAPHYIYEKSSMQTSDTNSDKQILGEHPTDELIKAEQNIVGQTPAMQLQLDWS